MITEKELIGKIQELRQIRPRKEWVFLTKSRILEEFRPAKGERFSILSLFSWLFFSPARTVFVSLTTFVFMFFGLFGLAQNALPGDLLYPIKKLTEKSQAVFISEEEKPKMELELANKRLEELNKIANENKIKKLAPALDEAQKSLTQASKNLKKKQKITREILDQTQKIAENKEKIEKVLGTQIGETEELENALKELIEREINDLENRTLTEEQEEILEKAKADFEAGNYSDALVKILILSQNNKL